MSILERVNGHEDLAALTPAQRLTLCGEIREFLISHVSQTGGHLASNLGVVELTVAIETVFYTETDRLVFDVGHQSYVHKLLTGRRAEFDHLRQFGGMAGFPKPSESPADAFVAGHASSSVSIALGMARARTLLGEKYHVVALLGDGAATGGMAYEGMNNAAVSKEPMVILLNDNEMSIDRNVGGVARHLARLRTKERYQGMKVRYRRLMQKIPGGKALWRATRRIKDTAKRILLPTTIFENMGLTYLGPVDGHDLPELIRVLKVARDLGEPVLVHVITQKGHGYPLAEADPSKFHGIGKFDPVTGETLKKGGGSFSDAFGKKMVALAAADPRVCAITAAMPSGTGLLDMKALFPRRLFDVGIAEEHAVSMAGGLAKQGMIPVVALYSTFLQRSYDQILQDTAMLGLHVVFAIDRAGLVGEDGETHHGVFDIGILRHAPNMQILCPASRAELRDMLHWAVEIHSGPVAVRYPRGGDRGYNGSEWDPNHGAASGGGVVCHRRGGDVTILTYGTLLENAMDAAQLLAQKGVEATVLRLLTAAPLDWESVARQMANGVPLVIAEETVTGAGIHEALAEALYQNIPGARISYLDLGSRFVPHGSMTRLYADLGLDGPGIAKHCLEVYQGEN